MINATLIDVLTSKIRQLVKNTPTPEVEKNLNALIKGTMSKFELVSREEYDVQVEVLKNTQKKLLALEEKLAEIEASIENQTNK